MRVLFINIIILAFGLLADAQDLLTLDAAIQTALQNNYNILIARNNATIADNLNTRGNAGFLPRLTTNGGYTYTISNSKLEFFSGDGQNRTGATNTGLRMAADLTWTAFDGFRMFAAKDRLELQDQRSQALIEKEMHDLVTQIQNAYIVIIRLNQQQDIIRESIRLDLDTKQLAEDKLRLGSGTELEVLQTLNQLNADSSAFYNLIDQIAQAQITLNQLMQVNPDFRYEVSTAWDPVLLPAQEELTSMAITQNYEIQLLDYDEKIALAQIKEARAVLYPTVDLNAGFDYNFSKAEAGFLLSNRTFGPNFGITFNYNIFEGRNLKKEVQNAELFTENIQLSKQSIEQNLKADIALLYQEYIALIDLYELESRNLITSERNVELATELYRLGRATDFEVREAILALQQIKDRQSDVQYRQKLAEIQLKSLAGIPMWEGG